MENESALMKNEKKSSFPQTEYKIDPFFLNKFHLAIY